MMARVAKAALEQFSTIYEDLGEESPEQKQQATAINESEPSSNHSR